MKKQSFYPAVITGLFCAFLGCGALLSVFLPKKGFSETENRYLAQLPQFSWDNLKSGKFGTDYEKYLSDQFPFRDDWIGVKTAAEQIQLKKEINGVWLGTDQYLIEALYDEDIDYVLYEKNLERLSVFAKKQEELLGSQHVRIMLTPSASEILTDKLPPFAHPFSQAQVLTDLEQKSIASLMVPVRDALLAAHFDSSISSDALYYRTDHHWTSAGAYIGYTAWADSLGMDPLAPSDFAIETVSTNFLGTIHSKLNLPIAPDSIQLYRPASEPEWNVYYDGSSQPAHSLYSMDALNTRDQYRVFLDGNHGWTKIENPAQHSDKKLLIIKDSYAHSFAPFAALHFDETHMIDLRYFNGKINQFIEEQGITDILVLYQIPGFIKDVNVSKLSW